MAAARTGAEETTALASQLTAGAINTTTAQCLFAESEGNPLFIVEMVRAELNGADDKETRRQGDRETRRQEDRGGSSSSGSPHSADLDESLVEISRSRTRVELAPKLPPTIYHVIQQRMTQLSPLARELAALAATIGRSFAFDLLLQASHLVEDEVVRGLDELWQRRIIREQGTNAYLTDCATVTLGIAYMLQGDSVADNNDPSLLQPPAGQEWQIDPPHLMIISSHPWDPARFSSDHHSGGPWLMFPGTPAEHLMVPVAEANK